MQLSRVSDRVLPEPESMVRRIRDHECGKHRPDDEYAELYCRVYGLSEHALFNDVDEETYLSDEIDAIELARRAEASDAAAARLRTAGQLADHAEHPEIRAWCLETEAWQALTEGEYQHAMILSQGAQDVAPRRSSAYIQATGQEGRAWARMGKGIETRAALNRIHQMVSPMPMPDRPEHHFRYDPAKSEAYTATTLSWLGDPAAVDYARQVFARLESTEDGGPRPRRAASARLDLALALLATDEPGEAGYITLQAVMSGLLVPSNYWRAKEVITGIEEQGLAEAVELREVYQELYGRSSKPPRPQLSV
ncbi:hypothetical protein [Nonomuraea mesophila]|uniref:hypothetical protein n=1 Tax=Nonomuraea mesophila TaxID=2530382 RepID=UPI001053196E|nr:hypothetical protein [Nonomuraea mesophila]